MSDASYVLGAGNYVIGHWFWELLHSQAPSSIKSHESTRSDREPFSRELCSAIRTSPSMSCRVSSTHHRPLALPAEISTSPRARASSSSTSTLARHSLVRTLGGYPRLSQSLHPQGTIGAGSLGLEDDQPVTDPAAAGERLAREMQEAGGTLIDMELSGEDMASLITCSDVYVSLHRSEDSAGDCRSDAAGRPAIATAYSGNMDFMISRTAVWLATGFALGHSETYKTQVWNSCTSPGNSGRNQHRPAARWMRLSTRTRAAEANW